MAKNMLGALLGRKSVWMPLALMSTIGGSAAAMSAVRQLIARLTGSKVHPEDCYEYFDDGILVVEDGKVLTCATAKDVLAEYGTAIHVKDCSKYLIMPGMIDCHIHFPQIDMIGSYGEQLLDWLTKYTFPAEERFKNRAYGDKVAKIFLSELLRSGTTSALTFCTVHKESAEALFAEAARRNMLMIAGKVMMDRESHTPETLRMPAQQSYEDSKALIERWHGHKRCLYAVTPRFAITSSKEELELAGKLLREHPGVYMQTHLSENKAEIDLAKSLYSADSYLDIYDRAGLLGPRSIFAHCVHLTPGEWERIRVTKSVIAFCPMANLFLGSGLFDYGTAVDKGVRFGIGTDVGAGTSFCQLQTLNEAYKVAQLQHCHLNPLQAVYLATLGSARALSLDDRVGNFLPGKDADFLLVDLAATPLMEYRMGLCRTLFERLFLLVTLGDDRAVAATYVAGREAHRRAAAAMEGAPWLVRLAARLVGM